MAMNGGATTAYDIVRYPNWPNSRSNPATLGALAQLLGRPAAPADKCRVLEIACNEGVNIASMAVAAPGSEFVGLDLAESAIERGRRTVALAGLANVTLHCRDIADPSAVEGEFDYIIAHGIYAWTPEPVRRAILRVMGGRLTPRGIAFLSYNIFPGCRLRQTMRDYLARMVEGVDDPRERVERARWALGISDRRLVGGHSVPEGPDRNGAIDLGAAARSPVPRRNGDGLGAAISRRCRRRRRARRARLSRRRPALLGSRTACSNWRVSRRRGG